MRTAEARDVLWEIYRIDEDPKVLVDLVVNLLTEPDVRGLAPELEPLYAQTPDDPWLARAWGMWLLYRGRADEALPPLERAARALANDPDGRFALAECTLIAGRDVDPSKILGPIPGDPVDASEWWLDRGRLEESAGAIEAALASFERSTRLNPRNRQAHHRLGQALRRAGREREASEALRGPIGSRSVGTRSAAHRALQRSGPPRDVEAMAELARICAEAGLNAEASAWCEQALKRDPSRRDVKERLDALRDAKPTIPIALARPVLAGALLSGPLPSALPIAIGEAPPFEERAEAAGISYFYESGASGDRMFIADTMGGGVGLIDADGDGWLDVYFVNGCRLPFDEKDPRRPNVLFRNRRDGTFEDITARAGVAGRGYGMGSRSATSTTTATTTCSSPDTGVPSCIATEAMGRSRTSRPRPGCSRTAGRRPPDSATWTATVTSTSP